MVGEVNNFSDKSPFNSFAASMAFLDYEIEVFDVEVERTKEHGIKELTGFSMPFEQSFRMGKMATQCYETYDLAQLIIRWNITSGTPVPEGLTPLAVDFIDGKAKRPSPAHRQANRHFRLNMAIFQLISSAIIRHDLSLTRNDTSPALSACDAVSDALLRSGLSYSFSKVKELCVSPRRRAERNAAKFYLYRQFGEDAVFLGKNFGKTVDKERFAAVMQM